MVQAREKGDYKKCPYIIIYTDFSIIFVGTYWLPCTSMKMYKDTHKSQWMVKHIQGLCTQS